MIIRIKATKEELDEMAKHFNGYVKIVVDIKREILAGGSDRHVDDEKALLNDGSLQEDLWGGGYDTETGEIDFNSMINLRPNQDNPSRDILSKDVRYLFDKIVRYLLS